MESKPLKTAIEPARLLRDIEAGSDKGLPPVDQWRPAMSGEMDMTIARNGQWIYQGVPIERDAMVRLFSTILRKDDDGHYYLVTPVEKVRIHVEDAPFVGVSMRTETKWSDDVTHFILTNVGDEVPLDAEHPLRVVVDPQTHEPTPYLLIRGRLEALLSRNVYYELANLAEAAEQNGEMVFGVRSGGSFFSLGDT